MKIEIKRWGDNDLYTEGQLFVNGRMAIPYTVEYHDNTVPTGTYEANLKKCGERFILSFNDESGNERIFIAGHSFRTSCKESAIVTGNLLIPGAVYKGRKYLERLIDRIRKAIKAGKSVTVIVTEDKIQPTNIIKHWRLPKFSKKITWSVALNLARPATLDDAAAKKAGGFGHREEGELRAVGKGSAVDGLHRAGQFDGEKRRATVEGI